MALKWLKRNESFDCTQNPAKPFLENILFKFPKKILNFEKAKQG